MGLSERIKSLRKSKNWTQIELAEKLNVTDKAVSKWENNEANPDILLLPDISKLFNVSIDFLLTGEEKIEISLDDMDDSKRIQYLIEKDDDKNFLKYDYCKYNRDLINNYYYKNNSIYLNTLQKYNNSSFHHINNEIWKKIIENKSYKIFKLCCENINVENKDNISLGYCFSSFINDFIKMAIDCDNDLALELIGLRYATLDNNSHYAKNLFYLPFVINDLYNLDEKDIYLIKVNEELLEYFFINKEKAPKCYSYITKMIIKDYPNKNVHLHYNELYYTRTLLYPTLMKLLVKYKDYETLKQYLIILTKELKDINCNNINIKINKYGFLYDNKQTSIWNSSIKIIGRIISFPNDVIESIILDNNLEFAKELINYNKMIVEKIPSLSNKIDLMTESEIKRICSIINPNLSDDEKLKATVVNKYIINLEKLKSIKNLELIKEVLDEYYYNYYELVYNLLDKNEYKKLYEFLIDYHLYALTKIFLKELGKNNSYQELLNKCYDIFILSNGDLDLAKNQNQLDSSFYVKYKYYRPLHSEVMKYIQEIKNDIYQSIKEEVEQ